MRAPGLGSTGIARIAQHSGGLKGFLSAKETQQISLAQETLASLRQPDTDQLEADLSWLSHPQHHLLTVDHPDYPPMLRQLKRPPAALFVIGNTSTLWAAQLAIVGSRNPSAGGRSNARDFSGYLASEGWVITSGLADGIDSEAHQAALEAGGKTVAVLGTGIDQIYPRKNNTLAEEITRQEGALVSEYPPGIGAKRGHFPARNRIISGLSLGTLVVEAGMQSGSLITARLAGEQGREVFAIPGSIHNPMAKGCHQLIRQGAKLVDSADDLIQELGPLATELSGLLKQRLDADTVEADEQAPNIKTDPDYEKIWAALGFDPEPVDQIIERSGLTPQAVSSMLLMLELRGMVEAHEGGAFSRK